MIAPCFVRDSTVDVLMYEIYLAPPPADPYWAARAIEALTDAGLVTDEQVRRVEERYRALKEKKLKRASGGNV